MEGLAKPALDFFGPFPIVQAAIFIAVLYGIYATATRGQRDSGAKSDAMPQWLLIGPLHDMMGAVHEVAEQLRRNGDLLERIDSSLLACKQTLEMIRNESRMR